MTFGKFMRYVFTDSDGNPSSKRVVMFLLVFLFIAVVIINLASAKKLESTLQDQLFYLLCWMFSVVFGEKVAKIWAPTIKKETNPTKPNKEEDKKEEEQTN